MKKYLFIILSLCIFSFSFSQEQSDEIPKVKFKEKLKNMPFLGQNTYTYNYKSLSVFYPMLENPNFAIKSQLHASESILFEFQPIITLQVYNNFNKQAKGKKILNMSYYFSFRPQFRMYDKNSAPVQMPSYKFFSGLRHLYRITDKHYLGYGLESGHYSNGQTGCTWNGGGEDGSKTCDSLHASINNNSNLSDLINRDNGDFKTNLSQLDFAYKYISSFDKFNKPKQIHGFTLGLAYYHKKFMGFSNLGGISENSVDIYGKWRFLFSYAYTYQWKSGYRIQLTEGIEYIQGAHPFINPIRSQTSASVFLPRNVGFFLSYTYGHDDYNLRFVDSGHQFGIGMTWDVFAPIRVE